MPTIRSGYKGSFKNTTANINAKSTEVSRTAATVAMGAWVIAQRTMEYEPITQEPPINA
jgi:hypothetical protein